MQFKKLYQKILKELRQQRQKEKQKKKLKTLDFSAKIKNQFSDH